MSFLSDTVQLDDTPPVANQQVTEREERGGRCESQSAIARRRRSEDGAPVVLVNSPNPHLCCPVCTCVFTDPVINVTCGHTFCRPCLIGRDKCPVDQLGVDLSTLVINRSVVGQIEDLLIHCCYGVVKGTEGYEVDPTGCQEHISLGTRRQHEHLCTYAPIPCPHSPLCGHHRQREIEQHLQECRFTPCHHRDKGCEFTGTLEDITSHTCGYRGLTVNHSLLDTLEQNKMLEEKQHHLQEEVSKLKERVRVLETEREGQQALINTCISNYNSLKVSHDNIHSMLDQILASRNRRSTSSPGNSGEGRPRSSSTNTGAGVRSSPPSSQRLEKWQMPFQFKCIGTLRGHKNVVWCLALYKNKLCSSGADFLIKIWDLENLVKGCVGTLEGHTKVVHTMAVRGECLYSAGEDLSIKAWNLESFTLVTSINNAHDNIITSMVMTKEFIFTSSHSTIKVWDRKLMQLKTTLTGLNHWVRALCLNHQQETLYSGSHNVIDVWDAANEFARKGKIEHTFGSVYSLVITQQYIIAGTYNRLIQLFDTKTHNHINTLQGHVGVITSMVTSPSGRFLFSASSDCSVLIWNMENLLPIQPLKRHEGSINCLILHGDLLMSGSEDREIKVYKHFGMQMGFTLNDA